MTNLSGKKPIIGVHVLSEFVFCPRAGIVCYGERTEDSGQDDTVSNLDFMPFYELQEIDRAIAKLTKEILWSLVVLLLMALVLLVVVSMVNWVTACFVLVLTLLIAIYPSRRVVTKVADAYRLFQRQQGFANIAKNLPDLNNKADEELDWRSIIRCNFDLERCQDAFFCSDLGVAGRPWKLLKRKNLCIPVFKCKPTTPKNPAATRPANWLYQQHYVRIAAYCELIEKCTTFSAPFGLVLFSGTYRVFAIKTGRETNEALERALNFARKTIERYEYAKTIDPPDERICRGCRHGFPREYVFDITILRNNGKNIEPNLHIVKHQKRHSRCGDLFKWIPPHEEAIGLGLREL